jgi:hypothetical protein
MLQPDFLSAPFLLLELLMAFLKGGSKTNINAVL